MVEGDVTANADESSDDAKADVIAAALVSVYGDRARDFALQQNVYAGTDRRNEAVWRRIAARLGPRAIKSELK